MDKVVSIENLYKKINDKEILQDINLDIYKNDIFGYLGPNGAGKTTTIRILSGLLEPTNGRVLINGENPKNKEIRKSTCVCLDDDGLYLNMTAEENLKFIDIIYNDKKNRDNRINSALKKVDLYSNKYEKAGLFSKGMKKRLSLAKSLLINPKLLILDEPMLGLDPDGQAMILNLIKEISAESTVFFSSHNLNDVQNICNRIAIINKKMLLVDSVDNILHSSMNLIKISLLNPITSQNINDLKTLKEIDTLKVENKTLYIKFKENIYLDNILLFLMNNNLKIKNIEEYHDTLINKYFELVKGDNNEQIDICDNI